MRQLKTEQSYEPNYLKEFIMSEQLKAGSFFYVDVKNETDGSTDPPGDDLEDKLKGELDMTFLDIYEIYFVNIFTQSVFQGTY